MKRDAPALVDDFAAAVMGQTDVMLHDPKAGNKCARKYINCARKLRSLGDVGQAELSKLFRHPRPDVQVAAAAYLLDSKTEEAMTILTRIAKGEGLIAFEAREAMKRWEEGNWHLDE
jgi:hypothetical protein